MIVPSFCVFTPLTNLFVMFLSIRFCRNVFCWHQRYSLCPFTHSFILFSLMFSFFVYAHSYVAPSTALRFHGHNNIASLQGDVLPGPMAPTAQQTADASSSPEQQSTA